MTGFDPVTIVEVGPRDGFQAVGPFISTDRKIAIGRALADSGLSRIEIGSFVSPSALPQMADIREVLGAMPEGPEYSVLVPNLKGAELAIGAGVDNLVYVVSVSEAHNAGNVRRSVEQSLADLKRLLVDLRPGGRFRLNVATAFDCPYEGRIPLDRTLALVEHAVAIGAPMEICLCDTTGKALPVQVAEAFDACRDRFGGLPWAYHAHGTYGLGLATTMTAYEHGVRIFDASIAGLGGCPFAPGATGNVATEDVVFLFEKSGIATGVDFPRLVAAARLASGIEGGQTGGHLRGIVAARAATRARGDLAIDALLDA